MTAKDVSKIAGYNPTAVGKNRPFWRQLHQEYERMRSELDPVEAVRNQIVIVNSARVVRSRADPFMPITPPR